MHATKARSLTEQDAHLLQQIGIDLLEEGDLVQARVTLREVAAIFDGARAMGAKAQTHLVIAELEHRVPDHHACHDELYVAFLDASAAGDNATAGIAYAAMYPPGHDAAVIRAAA